MNADKDYFVVKVMAASLDVAEGEECAPLMLAVEQLNLYCEAEKIFGLIRDLEIINTLSVVDLDEDDNNFTIRANPDCDESCPSCYFTDNDSCAFCEASEDPENDYHADDDGLAQLQRFDDQNRLWYYCSMDELEIGTLFKFPDADGEFIASSAPFQLNGTWAIHCVPA